MIRFGAVMAASILATSLCASEIPSSTGVPVSVLVTVRGQGNEQAPQITPDNILVSQGKQRRQIASVEPLHAADGLQLWILIDDGSGANLGSQIGDLKQFVLAQPASTQIGIGYLRNGMVEKLQALTTDHELVAKSMRLPTAQAGISASPYQGLEELVKKWPASPAAREVLMITSGIDPDYGASPENPYLESAVHAAQRAGVVVYSIYYPGAGRLGRSGREVFWGQSYISQLTDETGGELFWLGPTPPVSLKPYLDDIGSRLNGQYLLTFVAKPETKSGLQRFEVKTELPHVHVKAPSQVYVPGDK
jgi:hypothetical protein